MKLVVYQEELPPYRIPFFNELYCKLNKNFELHIPLKGCNYNDMSLNLPYVLRKGRLYQSVLGLNFHLFAKFPNLDTSDSILILGNLRSVHSILLFIYSKVFTNSNVLWWGHVKVGYQFFIIRFIRNLFYRFSDFIVLYSDRDYEILIRELPHLDGKIIILNNGLDQSLIDRYRQPYDFRIRGKNILFMGRNTIKSEFRLLYASFKDLPSSYTLHVIGVDQDEMDLDFLPNVKFYGEIYDEERISYIVNKCAVFVYPGSVGLSLIHALSYGIPILVYSDINYHMPEISSSFEPNLPVGLFFNDKSVNTLSKHILRIMSSADLNIWSQNALKITKTKYNVSTMADVLLNVI